ncbi:GNAT family N-acetyltransferase [Oceanobacillus arenosus]|uniref:GNAT family N-acetyltransferase n=1 Tax=Oceanobacillus arenosus TaxID=1229153 RepID=A0A3D8PMC7_9BACI|nr:GNAT family N-acetyltransferase [Oceanobacillus arenosus]RDW17144.1 GNAT family N-acetyltransferase [Oceanobacillus arenosus]
MEWQIKKFSELIPTELYQILKARVDVFVVEQRCAYPELDDYDQTSIHYELRINGELAAYLRILPKHTKYDEVSIGRVLVVEKYRRHGYARQLLNQAIRYIENEWNGEAIRIQAQSRLEAFYTSFGFRPISEIYLEDGIPHIDMIWSRN